MILACQKIEKAFGGKSVLNNVNFLINEGEKAAVIGINGAGKTTLFKIITGEYEADHGEVIFQKGSTYGYLSQVIDVSSHRSIYEEMLDAKKDIIEMEKKIRQLEKDISTLSGEALERAMESYSRLTDRFEKANGYAWKSEITGVLKGLGFDESQFDTLIHTLSGGQKTRVALSRILLMHPDLILLDEPTNHLDMESIRWLETFLSNYRGAVLIVSHDRYFLDKVVDKVIEIERGNSQVFNGNYSAYAEKKKAQRDAQMKLYMNQQQEIHHQEEVITKLRSFNREKSIKRAESREKMLSKIELVDKPVTLNSKMRITLEPEVLSGNDVLTIEGLSKSFGDKALFRNLNVQIKRGEVVGLLGANGTGKTTLLKIINRQLRADSGKIRYGSKVSIGYYDQEQHVLDDSKTIFDEISDAYPKLTNTRIRNVLAAFLFTGEDVFQVIGTLSGGEKGRVSLAKLMLSNANFIILDEPTNHLDIQSREILEEAINNYEGTVFYVSHDRYFLNKVCTQIADIDYGKIKLYAGNYDFWYESSQLLIRQMKEANKKKEEKIKELQEFISRFSANASKSKQATSRKRALEKIQLDDIQPSSRKYPYIDFRPNREIGNEVLTVEGLSKTIDGEKVLDNISFTLGREDKVAFVGKNGEGKSTLVKCIMKEIEHEGTLTIGHNVQIGYFAQNQASLLDENLTVFQTIDDVAKGEIRNKIRDLLGAFMFGGPEESMKKVKVLSGGERTRLAMIKLLLEPVNLLILDEPTNHLDMKTKDILKQALLDFDGTLILVSHDRDFLDGLVSKVYEFGNKQVKEHLSGIYEFLEKKKMDSLRELER